MSLSTNLQNVAHRRQFVTVEFAHLDFQILLGVAHVLQPADNLCNTLSALDSFRMIVAHFGTLLRFGDDLLPLVEQPSYRTDTHSRSVSKGVHRLWVICVKPFVEHAPVSPHRIRVAAAPIEQRFLVATVVQHGISNGNGTYRIVGV